MIPVCRQVQRGHPVIVRRSDIRALRQEQFGRVSVPPDRSGVQRRGPVIGLRIDPPFLEIFVFLTSSKNARLLGYRAENLRVSVRYPAHDSAKSSNSFPVSVNGSCSRIPFHFNLARSPRKELHGLWIFTPRGEHCT